MRVLLYCLNFAPELTGIGKYTGDMAEWLTAAGHEVRVVTAPPYYPDWRTWPGYRGSWRHCEKRAGMEIFRAPLWVPQKPSGLKRLLHLASFSISSFPLMLRQLRWRPDVVWVVEPPLFCAPTALFIAHIARARAWLHVQDYEVDAAFALGLLKGRLVYRLVSRLETWLMRRFDRVSTIGERMMDRAASKGVKTERLALFPNWIDLGAIRPLTVPSSYRANLGIPNNAVVALYSGNMGGKQGLDIIAQAAQLLSSDQDVHFVFCGNGVARKELEQQTHGLTNVRFIELQPVDQLNDLLGLADIHLLPQSSEAADLVMPSKLTGMLASGRAVVATAHEHTELGKVVQRCGVVVPPGDPIVLAEAIRHLASEPLLRRQLGAAGRRYAETHLGREGILMRFAAGVEEVCAM